jgi:quercetin dioxygenase-like cupin family protein
MSHRIHLAMATITVSSILSLTGSAQEATAPAPAPAAAMPAAQNVAEMKFVAFPGMPTCASGSVQNGDPTKGPSILLAKMAAGCVFPWHWHTPNEHLMMVSGTGRMEMKDGKPVTLRPGGFAMMPSRHVHQFGCSAACSLYVYSDGAFDMHYVDAQGQEISPEAALMAVKETPAPAPK